MLTVPIAVKYGFLGLVLTGAGFLIANTVIVKKTKIPPLDDLTYDPQIWPLAPYSAPQMDPDWRKCISEPRKTFCLSVKERRLEDFEDKGHSQAESDLIEKDAIPGHRHPLHQLLEDFSNLMLRLNIEFLLIEPSMLFCMLAAKTKFQLLNNGFNPTAVEGSRRIITVALLEEPLIAIEQIKVKAEFEKAGFTVHRSTHLNASTKKSSSHYLLTRRNLSVHAVTVKRKNSFLFHAAFDRDGVHIDGAGELLFDEAEAWDNFTTLHLDANGVLSSPIHIPSEPHLFLSGLESARFLHCRTARDVDPDLQLSNDKLSTAQLSTRVSIAVSELRRHLRPRFVNFFLWAESLKAWQRECNIFSDSSEFSVAMHSAALKDLDLKSLFENSHFLSIKHQWIVGGAEAHLVFDCYGLILNVFVLFSDNVETWYFRNTGLDNITRIVQPMFRLCSTEIFDQKMHLPCEL